MNVAVLDTHTSAGSGHAAVPSRSRPRLLAVEQAPPWSGDPRTALHALVHPPLCCHIRQETEHRRVLWHAVRVLFMYEHLISCLSCLLSNTKIF